MVWIFITDSFLETFVADPDLLTLINIAKGWLFVAVTAAGLFYFIKIYEKEINSERLKLEKKEESLTLALDLNKMAAWEYYPEPDRYITSSNHHGFFDFPQSVDLSLKHVYNRLHPDDLDKFKAEVSKTLDKSQDLNIEYRVVNTDGSIHWLWTKGAVRKRDGEVESVSGITSDVTESKILRRKLDFEREKFETLFDRIPVLISVYDSELNISEVNSEFVDVLGLDPSKEISSDFSSEKNIMKEVYEHMSAPGSGWKEFEVTTKSGEKRHQIWSSVQLSDSTIVGIGHDITERKNLEQKEKKSHQRLLNVFNKLPIFINILDDKNNIVECNDFVMERLGYDEEDIYEGDLISKLVHSDDARNRVRAHVQTADHSWKNFDIYTSSGDKLNTSWMNMQLNDSFKLGVGLDLTELKELEEQIELSRTRLKQATNSANIGLWEWNPQTGEIVIDEIWAKLVGYTLDELEPLSINTWNDLVHPDDFMLFEKAVEDYFSGKTDIYEIEVRMRHKDGHWVWILDRGKNVERDFDGNPVKMIGTHVDITNLKLNERRLKENEQLLIETQRVANLGTFIEDLTTNELHTSKVLNQMFWLAENETLTSERLIEFTHPDFKYVADLYRRSLETGETFESEYKIQNKKDKRERWVYEKTNVEYDKNGNPLRIIGVMLDVTRAKEQELRIKRTLAQLRKAEQIAEIGYWEKNLDTGKIFWGDNKYKLYDADPFKGPVSRQEFFQRIHPDDRKATYDAYVEAENRKDMDVTYRFRLNDGTYKTFREKAEIVRDDATGNDILRGVAMDISSIRNIESQLEDEQARLRIITGLVSDVIWEWNFEYDTIAWSEGMESVFGYPLSELPAGEESWTAHIHPEDKNRVVRSLEQARNGDQTHWLEEYRFFDASGRVRYVLDQGHIFRDDAGDALKMVGAMIDQTESKESEQLLSSQAQLLEDISDAVIATDEQMTIMSWNRAAEMMYGWSEQEAIGKKIGELLDTTNDNENEENLFRELLEKEEWSGEVTQHNRMDEPITILSSVRVISDSEGNFEGAVAVNKDITAIKKIQEKLSYEQRRFEYATSVVSDAIWDANPKEKSVWWSEGFATHYKHEVPAPEEGFYIWKKNLHPEDKQRVIDTMQTAEDSGAEHWEQEYKFYRGDGTLATVLDRAFILRDKKGDIRRVIGSMNDITIEKEAEKELKRSEQQYRLLYEQSPLPMYIFDKDSHKFLSVNEALTDLFGYSEQEFLEMTIYELFLPEEEDKIRKEARRNLKESDTDFDMWRQKTKDGSTLYCEISGSDINYKGKQQRLVITLDITEQRKSEERAIKAIVEGEERERLRIANELHDGLGQYLSAANMHLNTVYSDSESLPETTERSFKTGLNMLKHAISETRSISHNLLPKAIQDYGLKMAVESLVNEMRSTQDLSIHLFQNYNAETLPGNIQINIFRIIQEALNNAIKHSNGTVININLVNSGGELICTVEDNGSGFDPSNVANEGLGLQSMKTRVAAMSGNLDIDSKINSGTLITVFVPI